jgi:putative membrane protein
MSSEVHSGPQILITGFLIVLALVYLRGWYQLRSAFPNVIPGWRVMAFLGGLSSLWAATASLLVGLDHQLLTAHMVQHLLLMTVAAPLILLGAPGIAILRGIPQRFVPGVLGWPSRHPLTQRAGGFVARLVTHPVFCWFASTGAVIGWHAPAVFALGMHSERWHEVEQTCFLLAGLLFWIPVIQPWPSLARWTRWSIPLYLFLATLPCDALSAFLTFCDRVVYPHYLSAHRAFDISALGDQECAGALMWVWVTFVYLAPAGAVTIQMLSPPQRTLNAEAA